MADHHPGKTHEAPFGDPRSLPRFTWTSPLAEVRGAGDSASRASGKPLHPRGGTGAWGQASSAVQTCYRRLLSQSVAAGLREVRDGQHDHPDLFPLLVEESAEQIFDDPATALDLARLALALGEWLRDPELVYRARLELVNALRVRGEIVDAEREARRAGQELEELGRPRFLEGRYLHLLASLAVDQQRFSEALDHVDRAIELFRRTGEAIWECEALVKKGHTLAQVSRPSDALRALRQALPLLDPENHLRLFVICLHNLIAGLNELGYSIAARSLLADLKGLHELLGDELNLLRFRWLEGTIQRDLGQLAEAEQAFVEVQEGFLEQDLPFNAAIVSLHLAEVYLQQSRSYKLRELATRMFPIFQSRRIHREALAALIVFRESVALHTADMDLIRQLAAFLDQARSNPRLRFRPPG